MLGSIFKAFSVHARYKSRSPNQFVLFFNSRFMSGCRKGVMNHVAEENGNLGWDHLVFFLRSGCTAALQKFCPLANILTNDCAVRQCLLPHGIVSLLVERLKLLLCCHAPVHRKAWKKPNGPHFSLCPQKSLELQSYQSLWIFHWFNQNWALWLCWNGM